MKLVFILKRVNYYRILAPLISQGLRRNHTIEIWLDCTSTDDGQKSYLNLDNHDPNFLKNLSNLPLIRKITNIEEFDKRIKLTEGVDFFTSLHTIWFPISKQSLEVVDGRWCICMHGPDTFMEEPTATFPRHHLYQKYLFVYSAYWLNSAESWIKTYQNDRKDIFFYTDPNHVHIESTGMPMPSKDIYNYPNRNATNKKYDIPSDKEILIYFPFPYSPSRNHNANNYNWQITFSGLFQRGFHHTSRSSSKLSFLHYLKSLLKQLFLWFKVVKDPNSRAYLSRGQNEKEVIRSIRRFCDRNNLYFIAKPRKKFPFATCLWALADKVVDDDESQQHPSTLQELLQHSALTIGYHTTASLESIHLNVPYLNIQSPDSFFNGSSHKHWFPTSVGELFNFPGVIHNWSIDAFINDFDKCKIDEFSINRDMREHYIKMFIGDPEQDSSEKFYTLIERFNRYQDSQ